MNEARGGRQRLDKWLWFARIVKTRALAADTIGAGYVRVDGRKIGQPSYPVGPGHVLTVALPSRVLVLEILGCAERRGPFAEARLLYRLHGEEQDSEGSD